jgi:hypothetical protein
MSDVTNLQKPQKKPYPTTQHIKTIKSTCQLTSFLGKLGIKSLIRRGEDYYSATNPFSYHGFKGRSNKFYGWGLKEAKDFVNICSLKETVRTDSDTK